MTASFPIQKFRLGDRVWRSGKAPFVIDALCVIDGCVMYRALCLAWVSLDHLTLMPERPPYVASERRIIVTHYDERLRVAYFNSVCRCETDTELAARHAAERAAYDAQGDDK